MNPGLAAGLCQAVALVAAAIGHYLTCNCHLSRAGRAARTVQPPIAKEVRHV